MLGYVFTIPLALAAWSGKLSRQWQPESWLEWLGIFVGAAALAAVFWLMDLGVKNPGLSVIFNLSTTGLAVIALPSALRAAVLERLHPPRPESRQPGNELP